MKASRIVMAGMAGFALAASAQAAVNFGGASGYGTFVLQDATFNGGGTTESIAVGRNLTTNNVGLATNLSSSDLGVVVGNNLTTTGSIKSSAIVGGNYNGGNVQGHLTVNGAANQSTGWVNGGLTWGTSYSGSQWMSNQQGTAALPISFSSVAAELDRYSSDMARLVATGSKTFGNDHSLTLSGSSTTLNVFSLSASDFTDISSLKISAPTSSNIVINVSGSSVAVNLSMNTAGISSSNIVLNFVDATSVTFGGTNGYGGSSIYGTVLATDAQTTFNGGNMYGNLITDSLIANNITLQGMGYNNGLGISPSDLAGVAVPEPASVAVLGLAAFGLLARSGRKS